ncbi:MAG: ATP-binding protein [Candidatus Methanoplasma sp.]|jgi:AAA+ ATPase superfamily predicted ATPase|nr:ATP-binding protein [Candidatus Methanoplasma sp.]
MRKFLGRKSELDSLNEWYNGGKFEFVVMYGRRRVGKTSLIREFIKDKHSIVIDAMRVKGNGNLRSMREAVASVFGEDTENMHINRLLRIIGEHSDERLVLVIDEFPFFAESDEELLSSLQIFIDGFAGRTKLFVVLCGSSMSFMKRQVLGAESPLYGRRTHEMFLEPMDYVESSIFLKGRSAYEKACVYGAVGGVPEYLLRFSGRENIFRIMAEEFFSEGTTLYSEPESLLMQELRDPRSYNDIIAAMASGKARLSEISDASGINAPETSRILSDLEDLGYVEKVTPFNEKEGRRTRYFISDNLFKFRYYMAVRNRRRIFGSDTAGTAKNIEREMPDYMGKVFEAMCSQYIRRMGYPIVGKWWGPVGKEIAEIDVVASVADDGRVRGVLAECKFTKRKADIEVLDELRRGADRVGGLDMKELMIFSRSGFTDSLETRAEAERVRLISLEDMF